MVERTLRLTKLEHAWTNTHFGQKMSDVQLLFQTLHQENYANS